MEGLPEIKFFDAHTHVHFAAYDGDRDDVIKRASDLGIGMVTVGTQTSSSKRAVEAAKDNANIWAAVGFHPSHFAREWYHDKNEQVSAEREEFNVSELEKLADNEKVVAIGECGLDYSRVEAGDEDTRKRQKEGFVEQVELAARVGKPLMIHCRNAHSTGSGQAFGDLIDILGANRKKLTKQPIIHFFSGNKEEAGKLLEFGAYFTFGGVITFSRDYDEVIKILPMDRILSETDAPYVAPLPHRGKRNESAYVIETVKKLAEIKLVSTESIAHQILNNAEDIFNIVL